MNMWRNMGALVETWAIFNELAVCICNSVCCIYVTENEEKTLLYVSVVYSDSAWVCCP